MNKLHYIFTFNRGENDAEFNKGVCILPWQPAALLKPTEDRREEAGDRDFSCDLVSPLFTYSGGLLDPGMLLFVPRTMS